MEWGTRAPIFTVIDRMWLTKWPSPLDETLPQVNHLMEVNG